MKKALFAVIIFLAIATGATVLAQRPDPTGQGRYFQYGTELAYSGAQVIRQLPAGAECAPAGELVGARVWNSTRSGVAILSELTDKAEVAVTSSGIFLCKCAGGYNQLFLEKTASAPASTTRENVFREAQGAQAEATATASATIQESCGFQTIPEQNGSATYWVCPGKKPELFSRVTNPQPAPVATVVATTKQKDTRSFCERRTKLCVTLAIVGGVATGYGLAQIGGGDGGGGLNGAITGGNWRP